MPDLLSDELAASLPPWSDADHDELWQLRYRTGVNCGRNLEPDPTLTVTEVARWQELERRYDELLRARRALQAEEDRRLVETLTSAVVDELEALMQDPNASPTEEQARLWFAAVHVSEPTAATDILIEEGEPEPPETPEDRAWADWYARPISESLFRKTTRVRKPARSGMIRRPRPRGPRARRVRRRGLRKAGGRAGPSDREPEPPLSVVPLAAFRVDVDRWLGVA